MLFYCILNYCSEFLCESEKRHVRHRESTEKYSGDPGVDEKYCKGFSKRNNEKRFLNYMNVAMGR